MEELGTWSCNDKGKRAERREDHARSLPGRSTQPEWTETTRCGRLLASSSASEFAGFAH